MASHFVSLNRGQEGTKYSDFVTGAASSGNVGIELRLDDAAGYTKVDVVKALEAFERFFENSQQVGASGFVVSG
jgi:hypothetical protein